MNQLVLDPFAHGHSAVGSLRASPLRRVIGAVVFTPILKINDPSGTGIAPFQDAMRTRYPELQLEHEHTVSFEANEAGQVEQPTLISSPVWRLLDIERNWRLSVTAGSLAIETQRGYIGRDDLIARFLEAFEALVAAYSPVSTRRVGFRFFNMLTKANLAQVEHFVQPELIGFGNRAFGEVFASSLSQTVFAMPEGNLVVKSGFLQPGMVSDFMIEPAEERSWFLDIDASKAFPTPDEQDRTIEDISIGLTDRICTFFRWAMTEDFVQEYRDD